MPADGTILITDLGHAKLNTALNTETAVQIVEIAMGDGNGAVYEPGHGQTTLKRELSRVPITKRHVGCLLYTSPSPRDLSTSRMPSSA